MTVRNRIRPGDGDPRHGTYNGYSGHRCRCELCRAAKSRYTQQSREARSTPLGPDDPRHGKRSTYINYKCRCDECRRANAKYIAGLRHEEVAA